MANVLESLFANIANAIREKTGEPVTYRPSDFPSAIANIVSSAGNKEIKFVNFFDYDGSVVYSYTKEEFEAIDELPALPKHDGLIPDGWNWTIDEIKEYGEVVYVGAHYKTSDGKTRIYVKFNDYDKSPHIYGLLNGTITIEWGDGETSAYTESGKFVDVGHSYANCGEYIICISVEGQFKASSDSNTKPYSFLHGKNKVNGMSYACAICKIELGDNFILSTGALEYTRFLSKISVPSNAVIMANDVFKYSGLPYITLPHITSISESCFNNSELGNVSIPITVNRVYDSAFSSTLIKELLLRKDCVIGKCVSGCKYLKHFRLPDNMTEIVRSMFDGCISLHYMKIPKSISKVSSYSLYNAKMRFVDFSEHTAVPAVDLPAFDTTYTEIFVPANLYDEWCVATNWVSLVKNIVPVDESRNRVSFVRFALTNVVASNGGGVIYNGEAYTTTLSVGEWYKLSSVKVTMDDVDITSSVYSNGVVNIPSVTGAVIITANATAIPSVTVTYNLTNVTSSNSAEKVAKNTPFETTLIANEDYTLETVTITMGGTDITSSATSSGANISIANVTGNIVITATAT